MKLYGMLDSPFVRRVAISLAMQNIEFEHVPLSVFSNFDEMSQINHVVKVPTLMLDDATYLLDSTLILLYLEKKSAQPLAIFDLSLIDYQLLGLSLILAEKTVQHVYEVVYRPTDKQYLKWLNRLDIQITNALTEIERLLEKRHLTQINQMTITLAILWTFIQHDVPQFFQAERYPKIHQLNQYLEKNQYFIQYAYPQK